MWRRGSSITGPKSRFALGTRGTVAIEFAFTGIVTLIFIFCLLNLGDLALSLGVLQTATAAAAREVSLTAANELGTSGATLASGSGNCTGLAGSASSTLITSFNAAAAPLVPNATGPAAALAAATSGPPQVFYVWNNYGDTHSGNAHAATTAVPGSFITVTVTYLWKPLITLGMPSMPLRVIAVAPVSNSNRVSGGSTLASNLQCP